MGTVVFPEAPCKFFLDATPGERARRRWLQLKEMGRDPGDLAGLEEQIRRRDDQDRNRKEAPLRPAADAHCIDTTSIGLDEVFARILEHIPR